MSSGDETQAYLRETNLPTEEDIDVEAREIWMLLHRHGPMTVQDISAARAAEDGVSRELVQKGMDRLERDRLITGPYSGPKRAIQRWALRKYRDGVPF